LPFLSTTIGRKTYKKYTSSGRNKQAVSHQYLFSNPHFPTHKSTQNPYN
jgi:hypothetical protein